MRDLAFLGFIAAMLALGLKRPFLFALLYAYVDIVSPQRLSYYLLNSLPVSISVIAAGLCLVGWFIADDKRHLSISAAPMADAAPARSMPARPPLYADFPVEAFEKWDWAWKALAFAIFLPLLLRTRLRIEAFLLFMMLSIVVDHHRRRDQDRAFGRRLRLAQPDGRQQ